MFDQQTEAMLCCAEYMQSLLFSIKATSKTGDHNRKGPKKVGATIYVKIV